MGDTKQAKSQIIIPNTQRLIFKNLSKFDILAQMCMDGWQIVPPAMQLYGKWLDFEKLYKISHLEIDLHILDLNPLGHDCIHKKNWRLNYYIISAPTQLRDVR